MYTKYISSDTTAPGPSQHHCVLLSAGSELHIVRCPLAIGHRTRGAVGWWGGERDVELAFAFSFRGSRKKICDLLLSGFF
jgi:hypothetical protein